MVIIKYFEEAKALWKQHVPASGQSDTIDGELIRSIGRLQHEAFNNGNGNWDIGFEKYVEYIRRVLTHHDGFDESIRNEIHADLNRLLDFEDPCLDVSPYVRLTDRIVEWTFTHTEPIPREKDPAHYR